MTVANKTYRPKKGYEGMTLTTSLPDSAEDLVVDGEAWPYETESPTEQAALDIHPWITDRPGAPPDSDPVEEPRIDATRGALALAKAQGVDLAKLGVEGTGQGGRITKEDVAAHLAAQNTPEAPSEEEA